MEFDDYNEIVRQWVEGVLSNIRIDAEATLKNCNDIIDYGSKIEDPKLVGFGYYYIAETYYCLNDGDHFFEYMNKGMPFLLQSQSWELISKSYNLYGITATNRGNAPIALDYYLNGLAYCENYNLPEIGMILNINCAALNMQTKQYRDAQVYLERAYDFMRGKPNEEGYHTFMICIYQNLATCNVLRGNFDHVEDIYRVIHKQHWLYADVNDKISVLCSEALFYDRTGLLKERDECISQIDSALKPDMPIMDMFDDFNRYAELLLDCDKDIEFWHIIDIMEPMIRSINITNMAMREISLKIKYYRKHHKNAEYLQATGLYYELSEKKECETQGMMNNVLELRKRLENANKLRRHIEVQNHLLTEKSEMDALTKLPNRFKLNDYADKAFGRCYAKANTFAIEILDIDYFKEYNDNYGHQAGDACLVSVANAIKSVAEAHEGFCARYGGDEFILIYENISVETAKAYAAELKAKVDQLNIEHRFSKAIPFVSISQGICCDVPVKGTRVWDYLHRADDLLYKMKKTTRNNFCVDGMIVDKGE